MHSPQTESMHTSKTLMTNQSGQVKHLFIRIGKNVFVVTVFCLFRNETQGKYIEKQPERLTELALAHRLRATFARACRMQKQPQEA